MDPLTAVAGALDDHDPIIVLATWALVYALGQYAKASGQKKLRHALPLIALLVAIVARYCLDVQLHPPAGWSSVLHGMGAAGMAVLLHSQGREILKLLGTRKPKESPDA